MFLDFKVKEISHAKEGTCTGTELSASRINKKGDAFILTT